MDEIELFKRVGLALAIGLLFGIERGWHSRKEHGGLRIAGVRTFALMGLLGGVLGALSLEIGDLLLALAFVAFATLVITAHVLRTRGQDRPDFGITTEVASLLAFVLGMIAVRGDMAVAAAGAVVATGLLVLKPALHGWVKQLKRLELTAGIELLIISVVLLPLLPNKGYGPGAVLNPYALWWIVVLVAGLSFIGYVAIRVAGARLGTFYAALFGGLASSTAVAVAFARMGKESPSLRPLLAAGVVMAAATMFPRTLILAGALNWSVLPELAWPLGAMTVAGYVAALILYRPVGDARRGAELQELPNPLELPMALKFGAFLAVIVLLSYLARQWLGDEGLYLLAALSGLTDVDAVTVSMARMAQLQGLGLPVAATAITIAAFVNTLVKGGIVAWICGGAMAWRVGAAFAAVIAAGVAGLFLLPIAAA
ncbi:MAG: MgtC/SapB family protein [Alphaproteobacteria bacterium]|nr:MgtC/SapB family protein [Alphaproteobacteria bacterium]